MKSLLLSSFIVFFFMTGVVAQVNQVGATGPVGIGTGTNTPQAYLHVQRPASAALYTPIAMFEDQLSSGYTQIALKGTARQYHVGVGNNSETAFGIANKFYIWDQNAELPRFVVDASGNVGIGTTTPANKLSIYSATANTSGLQFSRLNNTATAVAGNGKVLSLDASGNVILVNESASGGGWALIGNAGSNPTNNFIGTTDNQPLVFRTNNVETVRLLANGNLGIGTNTPTNRLSIYSAAANSSGLQFARLNNTATAVAGNGKVLSVDASGNVILVNESAGSSSGWGLTGNTGTNPTTDFIGTVDNQPLIFRANNSEIMRIAANGNISIGTNDAKGHKLAVNGDAVFTKIKVKALLNWPDYVFSSAYDLRPLDELERFIIAHKHLPEIPSATEIEKEGLDVADNQAALLQKIEELTLYIINQHKMINQQRELINQLQDSFKDQKKDLDQIRMNLQKNN